jgi:hypothetical protein
MKSFFILFLFTLVHGQTIYDFFGTNQLDSTESTAHTWNPAVGYRQLFTLYGGDASKIESNQYSVSLHNLSDYALLIYNYGTSVHNFASLSYVTINYASQPYYMSVFMNLADTSNNLYATGVVPGAVASSNFYFANYSSHVDLTKINFLSFTMLSSDNIHRGGIVVSKFYST